MFEIQWLPEAEDDFGGLRKYDQTRIFKAIRTKLSHQPTEESKSRVRLFPNELAEWELRVDPYRVFYDVEEERAAVLIIAIGYKKGNKVYIGGKEFRL